MELINATRMTAGYNMGLEPSGRELRVALISSIAWTAVNYGQLS